MTADARYTFVADGDGVRIDRGAVPACRPTEALLRVRYSLVSTGTERHYVAQLAGKPGDLALGYCAVGTVVARGRDVDHVVPGDVAIAMGWTIATHSNYVAVPRKLVCPVGAGMRPEHALLATLGATAVHAADRAALIARDRVLVVGLGAVGTLVAMAAADRGCEVWGWDRDLARRRAALFWRELDPAAAPVPPRGAITAAFLCVDCDLDGLVDLLVALLDPHGNGARRSRIVNVGRVSGPVTLAPSTGNIDLINTSRCGAGYRDDEYHHGLREVPVPEGEHTVDDNLRRCLAIVAANAARLERLEYQVHGPAQGLARYNSPEFFAAGLHLIDHGVS